MTLELGQRFRAYRAGQRRVPARTGGSQGDATSAVFGRYEWSGVQAAPDVCGGCLRGVTRPGAADIAQGLRRLGVAARQIVVLDTETGGLGEARVCVAGLAWCSGEILRVEQWWVHSPAAEASLLEAVRDRLVELLGHPDDGTVLVTFNGASFDLPVLRSRCLRHRIGVGPFDGPHLDLLHVARRIWGGRVPDCRLGTLERTKLGIRRIGDLPGHLVPLVFERLFADPGDPAARRDVVRVVDHNRVDVVSLFVLLVALGDAVAHPGDPEGVLRAARHALSRSDGVTAEELLESLVVAPWGAPCVRDAALLLADRHRRAGRHGSAARLWARVCERFPGDPEACEALAKHLEHRAKDPAAALAVAAASRTPTPRRLQRLREKLAGRTGWAGV